jgi:hypothetical protein
MLMSGENFGDACLGSLLGWQFTIAQTGKSAADGKLAS